MDGLCSLVNVVYQAVIYPKENINDKKYYIGVLLLILRLGTEIINIPSPMSIKKSNCSI